MALIDALKQQYPGYSEYEIADAYSKRYGLPEEKAYSELGLHKNTGLMGDMWTSAKRTVAEMPGDIAGLADLPIAAATGYRPTKAAGEWLADKTNIHPQQYAEDLQHEYSPQQQAAQQEVDQAKGGWNTAKAIANNPRLLATGAAGLAPNLLPWSWESGLARGVGAAGRMTKAALAEGAMGPVRAGTLERLVGERAAGPISGAIPMGAQDAGHQNYNYEGPDAQRNALASIGHGLTTTTLAAAGTYGAHALGLESVAGRLGGGMQVAEKLGEKDAVDLLTADTDGVMSTINSARPGAPMSTPLRWGASALSQGAQGYPMGYAGQVWQNVGQGKDDITEGANAAGVSAALQGAPMGPLFNLRNRNFARENYDTLRKAADGMDQTSMEGKFINPQEEAQRAAALPGQMTAALGERSGATPEEIAAYRAQQEPKGPPPPTREQREMQEQQARLNEYHDTRQRMIDEQYDQLHQATQVDPVAHKAALLAAAEAADKQAGVHDEAANSAAEQMKAALDNLEALQAKRDKSKAQNPDAVWGKRLEAARAVVNALASQGQEHLNAAGAQRGIAESIRAHLRQKATEPGPGEAEQKAALQAHLDAIKGEQDANSGTVREGADNGQARGSEGVGEAPGAKGDGGQTAEAPKPAKKSRAKPNEASENGRSAAQTTGAAEGAEPTKGTKSTEGAKSTEAAGGAKDAEDLGLNAEVKTAETLQKGPNKADSPKVAAALGKWLSHREAKEDAEGKVIVKGYAGRTPEVRAALGDTATALLTKIHSLIGQRNKLLDMFSSGRLYEKDANGTWRRSNKAGARQTIGTAGREAGQRSVDTFYAERRTELAEVSKQLGEHFAALQKELGANNIEKAQEISKRTAKGGKQTSQAATFSSALREWKAGHISAETPMGAVSSKDIRERRELGTMKDTKLASMYHDPKGWSLGGKEKWKGVDAVLMSIRHHGLNPLSAQIAAHISSLFKDARKDPDFKMPEMRFYTDEGLLEPSKNGKTLSANADVKAPNPLGHFEAGRDGGPDIIHIGPKGNNAQVVLHELLHSALAGFIEKHPDHPAVKALGALREHVLDQLKKHPELVDKLGDEEAQTKLLMALQDKGSGLQEFLTYGLTHGGLQEAMRDMTGSKKSAITGFLKDTWNGFVSIARSILGLPPKDNKALGQFLHASGELLTAGYHEKYTGEALQADTVSGPLTEKAAYDATKYAPRDSFVGGMVRRMLPGLYGADPQTMRKIESFGKGILGAINEHSPSTGRFLANFNPRINVDREISALLDFMKQEKTASIGASQEFMQLLSRDNKDLLVRLFNYMDHLKDTLGKPKKDFGLSQREQTIARRTQEVLDDAIKNASDSVRSRLEGLNYGEMLTVITGAHDTVSRSVNVEGDKSILHGSGKDVDVQRDAILAPGGENSPLTLGGKFYAVKDASGNIARMVHATMAATAVKELSPGQRLDTKQTYRYDKPTQGVPGSSEKTHVFKPLESVKDSTLSASQLGAGLMNTLQHLSNANATRHYIKGLMATMGEHDYLDPKTGKTEKTGPLNVVFKTLDDVHDMMVERTAQAIEAAGGKADRVELRKNLREVKPLEPGERNERMDERYREVGEWVHVPDSPAWGDLAGHYVHGPVMASLHDAIDRHQYGGVAFSKMNRMFKTAVVGYNPSTWVVNTLGNVVFSHMNNIQYRTLYEAAKMFGHYHGDFSKLTPEQQAILSDFHKAGAEFGTWTSTEARDVAIESMLAQTQNSGKGVFAAMLNHGAMQRDIMQKGLAKAKEMGLKGKDVHNFITSIYAGSDNLFRLAAYMTKYGELQKQGNLKPEQMRQLSGLHAKDVFHDYDIDARALKWAKGTWLPFASFTYAATKRWMSVAKNEPWKIAEVAAMYTMADAVMQAATGDSDAEDKRKRARDNKSGKTWFGANQQMRMPSPDGKTVYMDTARLFPTPFPVNEDQPVGAWGLHWWPQSLTPNGLVMSLASSVTGTNLWTGKPVWKATDSDGEKFQKTMAHLGSTWEPGIAKKTVGVPFDGEHMPLGKADILGHIPDLPTQLIGATMLPVSQFDNATANHSQRGKEQVVTSDFHTALKHLKTQRDVGNITPREYLDKVKELKTREAERLKETTGVE